MVASKFFAEIGPATGVSKSDTSCTVAVEIRYYFTIVLGPEF